MRLDAMLDEAARAMKRPPRVYAMGRVSRVSGLIVEAHVPSVRIGDGVDIERDGDVVHAEVVGFRDEISLCVPYSDVRGISPGALVHPRGAFPVTVSDGLIGRAVDAFGAPIDGGPPIAPEGTVPLDAAPPDVSARRQIRKRFETGVKTIDALLTCGRGQRVGLFAGAGVGKTVLMRQIAEMSTADLTVIGLIGERGCEVRDILEDGLAKKTIVVAATSDRSPMERSRGARAATAIAEHFRDRGKHVLLILDSLTRYAMALREIGLSAGEPPATKGYPPSVFAHLPRLLERASEVEGKGSITGFYTVLVEGDDLADPVADSARSLLDGHIVLSRDLAARGHFPAIDTLASASRVARQVTSEDEQRIVERARAILATKREVDELRNLGAYVRGANPEYDEALELGARIVQWSRQRSTERFTFAEAVAGLAARLEKVPKGGAK